MAEKNMDAKISVDFEESSSRQQLNSGEDITTLFGKTRKFFSDLKAVAFSGSYADLNDKPESLPANGGNADKLDGRHCGRIATINQDGQYWDKSAENINDAYIQWDGSKYFRFKTYGGNLIHTDDADTVDGLHADDFVRAFNNSEIGNNRILIPNDVHVGDWLRTNAEVGMQYYRHSDCSGQTGLPDGTNDWAWFSYDGNRFLAKTIGNRFFYMNYINSYSGWIEIYTSNSKPYVTGEEGCGDLVTATIKDYQIFNFTPSAVICQIANSSAFFATIIQNGFSVTLTPQHNGKILKYIAFK